MIRLPNKICWCFKIIAYFPVIYLTGRHVSSIFRYPKDFKVKSLGVKHCLCCLFKSCLFSQLDMKVLLFLEQHLTSCMHWGDHRPHQRVFSISCQPELCKLMTCSRDRLCPHVGHPPVLPPALAPHWHWSCVPFPTTPVPGQAECTGTHQDATAKCSQCMVVSC